jgi:hypothetical protein
VNIRKISTSAYISSSPAFAPTPSGRVLVWGGDFLHVTSLEGKALPGWPKRGKRFFASSPSIGDVDGDGVPEIFCGNDDDCLYGWRLDGSPLPGFPIRTGGDVFSAPALYDLDGNGKREIIFGSDDGNVYVVKHTGRIVDGWPKSTGHFVASSPCVGDINGDGRPEIIIGSWDGKLYAWDIYGELLPGWPVELGGIVWSSPVLADIDGDSLPEVIVAGDQLYVIRSDGSFVGGFPRKTRSWMVSTPCVADVDGDGQLEIGIGSEKFYMFRSDGTLAPGFPVDLEGYIWASPIAADIDDCGSVEWIVGSWSGTIYAIGHDGKIKTPMNILTSGPVFSSCAVMQTAGRTFISCGSWDKSMYLADLPSRHSVQMPCPMFRGNPERVGQAAILKGKGGKPAGAADITSQGKLHLGEVLLLPESPVPREIIYVDLQVGDPDTVQKAMLLYNIDGVVHPSPMVLHRGLLRGMIHPLRPGTTCSWHLEISSWDNTSIRLPEKSDYIIKIPY